jgi:hypothetical protein
MEGSWGVMKYSATLSDADRPVLHPERLSSLLTSRRGLWLASIAWPFRWGELLEFCPEHEIQFRPDMVQLWAPGNLQNGMVYR